MSVLFFSDKSKTSTQQKKSPHALFDEEKEKE